MANVPPGFSLFEPPSRPSAEPPSSPHVVKPTPLAAMPTFCRCLLECRDPFDGRNLLLLACGAGSTQLVELLLTHAERSHGSLLDAHARSHVGETALHLAAASGHFDICKMLLLRTNLQLRGPAAESLLAVTPLQLAGTAMHW